MLRKKIRFPHQVLLIKAKKIQLEYLLSAKINSEFAPDHFPLCNLFFGFAISFSAKRICWNILWFFVFQIVIGLFSWYELLNQIQHEN